ncbi:MAG: polysaccharide deacetylase family protein [Romboutsia sp.]
MKNKSNKTILIVIISLILVSTVIAFKILIKEDTKESSVYSKNSTILRNIENKTLSNIIDESTEEIYKGPRPSPEKVAYITIDDGPSKYTNEILDILKKNNVYATFFMIEGNMRTYSDELKNIEKEGHSIGFHSITHDIKQLYKTPEATLEEFKTCNDTFYNITGEVSNLIRLPYGSKPYMPDESYKILTDNGYLMWDWNLDTEDWRATTDNILSNVLYYGRDKQHIVLLMHEKEQTVNALDGMIKILKERGYTILPITESTKVRNFWNKNL